MNTLFQRWVAQRPSTSLIIDPHDAKAHEWAMAYLRKALCLHGTGEQDCSCKSCHLLNLQQNATEPQLNAHPDAHFFPEKAKTEDIRSLLHKLSHMPTVSPYHGVFLGQIDEYNESALSALLKTLEEPLSHTIFVLSARQKRAVKATILSRCHVVVVDNLSHQEAIAMLMNQARINEQAAEALLYTHQGNPYEALLHRDDTYQPLETLNDCAHYLAQPKHSRYLSHLDQIPDKALLNYLCVQIETLIRLKQLDSSEQSWQNFAPIHSLVQPEYLEPLNLIALHTLYARLQQRRRPNLTQTGQRVNVKSLFIQYHHRNDSL
ncbi:MAG: DNA polymerase III subunit delta' [Cardiobacteriaceae bacterium]|nr:DNA polymerase III subunit delta' [Cardiobacteriaceae bacterium]